MLLNEDKNSRKILYALFGIVAAVLVLFILNKIETAPQNISSETAPADLKFPSKDQRTEPSFPAATKEATVKDTYPKQMIIGLKSWSDIESARQIIVAQGGEIVRILNWPTKNVIVAIIPSKEAEAGILKNSFWGKLIGGIGLTSFGNRLSGGVDYVEKDVNVYAQGTNLIDWGVKRLGADKVWATSASGKGVKVAVIDSGIQRNHPDLVANLKDGISFVPGLASDQWDDEEGHGTEVAGLIAASNNDIGYVGVAPEADLYSVRVLDKNGSGSISTMISGIYWAAANGMNVANISLGWHLDPNTQANTIAEETMAVNYAYDRGVVLVASSGNSGSDPDCNKVMYPAALTSAVIAVGATLPDNTIAPFSCHGPEVELVAPGLGNWAPGLGSTYAQHTGTSVSAPFIAGAAALIISDNVGITPAQVRDKLHSIAIDLGTAGRDEYYGYGIINLHTSDIPPVTFSLIYPKGGEQWFGGVDKEVSWSMENASVNDPVDSVDIQLIHQHDNIDEFIPLAMNAPNNGKASVNVPAGLPVTGALDSYFLQISCGKGYFGNCRSVKSGILNIQNIPSQALRLVSPNGGEKWGQGTRQSVVWTANYLGGLNLDIDLLENQKIPSYSLSSAYDGWSARSTFAWTAFGGSDAWGSYTPPPDTCNGNISNRASGGVYSCPATNSGPQLTCLDVAESPAIPGYYYGGYVKCAYQQTGSTDKVVPVKKLAQNIPNTGSAEINLSSDLVGSDYFIKLSCYNFTGDCAEGLSAGPFSILHLSDPVTLTINKSGDGTVGDGNIVCGSGSGSCTELLEKGTIISLSAISKDPTVIFTGWEGACSGLGVCQIGMTENRSVTAVFAVRAVTLTATPEPGSIFTGWEGACLSNGECTVSWSSACLSDIPCNITMGKDEAVKANFVKNTVLNVTISGTGTGTVTGNNKNINCSSGTCSQEYGSVTDLETLRATSGSGSSFIGWFGGSCSGASNLCFLQMSMNKNVIAVFNLPCTADTWVCEDWSTVACSNDVQTRRCELINCPTGVDTPSPATTQSCGSQFTPGGFKEVKPN